MAESIVVIVRAAAWVVARSASLIEGPVAPESFAAEAAAALGASASKNQISPPPT